MDDDQIAAQISGFIRERFLGGDPHGELTERTPLLEWGVLNSLNTVLLLNFVRDKLGVSIPPSRINARDLKDINAISGMVRELANPVRP